MTRPTSSAESRLPACVRCGGDEDLMDRGMAPGMTYCAPCRKAMMSTPAPDLFARFNALVIECGRQEALIYSGKGVPPNEALPFLVRVARLAEGLCGVMSMDTYDDVIEALEDAI